MKYGVTKGFADYYNGKRDTRGKSLIKEQGEYKVALGVNSILVRNEGGKILFCVNGINTYILSYSPMMHQFLSCTGVRLNTGEYYDVGKIDHLLDIPRAAKDCRARVEKKVNDFLKSPYMTNIRGEVNISELIQDIEEVVYFGFEFRNHFGKGLPDGRGFIPAETVKKELSAWLNKVVPAYQKVVQRDKDKLMQLLKDIERRKAKADATGGR